MESEEWMIECSDPEKAKKKKDFYSNKMTNEIPRGIEQKSKLFVRLNDSRFFH